MSAAIYHKKALIATYRNNPSIMFVNIGRILPFLFRKCLNACSSSSVRWSQICCTNVFLVSIEENAIFHLKQFSTYVQNNY